jgi:nitroreductase
MSIIITQTSVLDVRFGPRFSHRLSRMADFGRSLCKSLRASARVFFFSNLAACNEPPMPKQEEKMDGLIHEIEIRRAKRALSEENIPDEKLRRIMRAATYAPSCFNNQPWRFVVVNERSKLEGLHEALSPGNYWVKKAPAVVVVATKPDLDARLSDRREYALLGCGLATENLMLQAYKEGVIAHAIAGFDPLVVKKKFGIPDDYIVITLVALGYPGDESHLNEKHLALEHSPRQRKPEPEVICWNTWCFQDSKPV